MHTKVRLWTFVPNKNSKRVMNTTLWGFQGLLAAFMFLPRLMKLTNSNDQLIKKGNGRMDWAEDISAANMKIIGVLEVLAAIGLVVSMSVGLIPILTPFAAIGVILTMMGAILLHLKRGDEPKAWGINIMILLMAAFVAYGRFVLLPV